MTLYKYIIKSLWFFRKQHIAVLAGTIISTAVLTGALIIGDSVKFSLRNLVEKRLGDVEYAMHTGDRFVSSETAEKISEAIGVKSAAVLSVKAIAVNPDSASRVNKTITIGIDNNFWKLSDVNMPDLSEDEAIVNTDLAAKLHLKVGDEFLLKVENAEVIPLNAPFASEEQSSVSLRLKIKAIAQDDMLGRFSLKSNQATPYNVFVLRDYLAKKLDISGLANIILSTDNKEKTLDSELLNKTFKDIWSFTDAGIKIRKHKDSTKYDLVSDRIFIDQQISNVVKGIPESKESVLTYLVNGIAKGDKETPYSFVAAVSERMTGKKLKKDEIIINEWIAEDLNAGVGDTINVKYFVIGPLRNLQEVSKNFTVKSIIPNRGSFADNSLMPSFPGMSEAGHCRDWETGVPIDLDKIRTKDEDYWTEYKGTPKAFISIDKGLELWNNKFGNYTTFRFNKKDIDSAELENKILADLSPRDINLFFNPVKQEGLKSVKNSVDFGELFLSLSFFVIVGGILLTVLIYSLNTESRRQETGILSGLGFNKKLIVRIRFYESVLTAISGGILGIFVGILYNYALMAGLNSVWNDAVRTNMLQVFINPGTLMAGFLLGVFIALISIWLVTRKKLKAPISGLIKNIGSFDKVNKKHKRGILNNIIMYISTVGLLFLMFYSLASENINPALFLTAGALFIFICVLYVNILFRKVTKGKKNSTAFSLNTLAFKNAARNKGRSIAVISLLALGTFSIIITGANRKSFEGTDNIRQSGTGGYTFWAESSFPILNDLNTTEGKEKYGLDDEKILDSINFIQFHNLQGDDASCLNLNQVNKPQILGINSNEFNSKKAFSFAKLLKGVDTEAPWTELEKDYGENIIPAYADQTVIQWGLMKSVGDTLLYLNEEGTELKLLLIGGLNSSVFQGNLLISDKQFSKNFPSVSGSKIMLIETKNAESNIVSELLEAQMVDYGIDITPTTDRLEEFNSVTNTYLNVFVALGGLGVIIGTFGLGIVLLRNILERKRETAVLTALGYKCDKIFKLIFTENIILLVAGLTIGIVSAFIGILPSIISPSFTIPWVFVLILIGTILLSGIIWIYFPAKRAIKGKLIEGLRNE